jgi:peptide/nickel transport system substrate-binding protein
MENRFGIKDFALLVLLVILSVLVWLAIVQSDRQWKELTKIRAQLDDQGQSIRRIEGSGGVVATTTAASHPIDGNDPFARIRAAEKLPGYAPGDWLVTVFPGQVAKITPLLSGDVYAAEIQDHILETLATRDPDTLEWRPLLALDIGKITDNTKAWAEYVEKRKKVPLTEDEIRTQPDFPKTEDVAAQKRFIEARLKEGRRDSDIANEPDTPTAISIRFTMRPNVRFSDGVALTADDVVFSYNFIMNPNIADPRSKSAFERIKSVKKIGNDQVEFIFKEPYFQAYELAASMPIMPEHFYSKFKPAEFNQSVGLLLGSGPYRMEDPESWKPGTTLRLVRNNSYWGAPSAFNVLVFREISSDKGRLAAFRNGEVDVFGAAPEQYVSLIKDEALMKRVQRFEFQSPVGGYRFVAWNEKNDLFRDKKVRQAMAMLLNRDRMIKQIVYGYAVQATGPFSPLTSQCDLNVKPWPYDVEQAKKLLAEAGFADRNGDGIIENAAGKPFEFKLTYPGGGGSYEQMVLFMKDAYARAGIGLKPDPLEWGVFTDRLENKNFEAISLGWSSGIENDIFQMFHSSQAGPGGDNFISYANPQLDSLITQARTCVDEATRMPLWKKCHDIIHEDQPYLFLWYGKNLNFIDQRIHNVKQVKLGLNPSDEWFVPLDQQRYTQ